MERPDSGVVRTNADVARGVYDGWMDGDVTRALEFLDPEVVWEAIADAPDAGTYRGHAGARRYMEDWLGDFDFLPMEFKQVVEEHDRLAIAQCARAKGKGSGVETEIHYAVAYRLSDGKIIEVREFRTMAEALEAANLRP
jgi:ketosteroid isomerase-like protein